MNWKECAYLFSNGKFKFKEFKFQPNKIHTIDGYNNTFTGGCFVYEKGCLININYCTLIARKIEDMTDEEIILCPTYKENDITPIEEMKYRLVYWTNFYTNLLPAQVQNYLLSIGVYPFDQSHFVDGTVIDIKTL